MRTNFIASAASSQGWQHSDFKRFEPGARCSAGIRSCRGPTQCLVYGLNYPIDVENAVIVDVEATPARTYDEVAAAKTMIERTEQRIGLKPQRVAADTAYGTGNFLCWLVGAGIAPQIPV